MKQIYVLVLIESLNRAGVETMLMNYMKYIDRNVIKYGFLVNTQEKSAYEDEVEAMGGVVYHMCKLNSSGYKEEFKQFLREHPEYEIIHSYLEEKSVDAFSVAKDLMVPVRIAQAYSNPNIKDVFSSGKKNITALCTEYLASNEKAAKRLFGSSNLSKVKYMRPAIDVVKFQYNVDKEDEIRKELDIKEDQFVISCIGRFAPEKNQEFVLEIFQELTDVSNAILLFVGEGRDKKEMRQKTSLIKKAQRLGISDKVKFLGSREDVDKILCATDALLMPSKSETVAMTLIEAQASGVKCIASDCISKDCCVTDGVTMISLKKPAKVWACNVMDIAFKNKKMISVAEQQKERDKESLDNCTKMLREGNDILENAKWLQNFYQECMTVIG